MTEDKHQQILMNNREKDICIYTTTTTTTTNKKNKEMRMWFFFVSLHKTFIQRRVRHLSIAQTNEIVIEILFCLRTNCILLLSTLWTLKKKKFFLIINKKELLLNLQP
jgi:hypothetical protein